MQLRLLLLRENPEKFGKMSGNYFHTVFCSLSGLNADVASLL